MDVDNSVVIAGGKGNIRKLNGKGKIYDKDYIFKKNKRKQKPYQYFPFKFRSTGFLIDLSNITCMSCLTKPSS